MAQMKKHKMTLRKLHAYIGILFAPFFLLTSITGILLLFRKAKIYSFDVKEFIQDLHSLEIVLQYVGGLVGLALLFMTITGIILTVQIIRVQIKNKSS